MHIIKSFNKKTEKCWDDDCKLREQGLKNERNKKGGMLAKVKENRIDHGYKIYHGQF